MMKVFFLFLLQSCALFSQGQYSSFKKDSYIKFEARDYQDHLIRQAELFTSLKANSLIKLDQKQKYYLNQALKKIVVNNELILGRRTSEYVPEVKIIRHKEPYYFSAPNGKIFLSLGLLKNYIGSEGLLVAILAKELIRSYRLIYPPIISFPTGSLTARQMLKSTKIPLKDRAEVNKWAYFALRRAGFLPSSLLSWIQIQNRNTLDFTLLLDDTRDISREEFMLKQFIVEQEIQAKKRFQDARNSSKSFYYFISEIKKEKI